MKKKKIIAMIMVCVLMAGLVACGKADNSQTSKPAAEEKVEEAKEEAQETSNEKTEEVSEEKAEETAEKEAGKPAEPVEVMVCLPEDMAMGTTFEIWNSLIEPLKAEGIELQTFMYTDQQVLKSVMDMGLATLVVAYKEPEDTSIIAYTLCIPYSLYSEKYSTTEEMADAKAFVGFVRNDDWVDYFDVVLGYGYTEAREPIFTDPNNDNEEYWQKLYCRTEDTQDPGKMDAYEKVVKAFQSENVREILKNTMFTPAGWDQDLISQYR